MIEPLYEEIQPIHVDELINLFSDKKDLMVLTSAMPMENDGRYSFICFDAFWSFSAKGAQQHNPFDIIHKELAKYPIKKIDGLPPFQGGAVGYFGYEAAHYLEELPHCTDNIALPDVHLNFYSHVIAIDHTTNQCWIIATGFPEKSNEIRIKKARLDINTIKKKCQLGNHPTTASINIPLPYPVSNFHHQSYINAVNLTKEYILNGDIFEANISQQFNTTLPITANIQDILALYAHLMKINPAPFSAFLRLPNEGYILSASPERFIKLTHQSVESCPIKGTRKRSMNPEEDKRLARELLNSEKDQAENIMIVDLMRNDMSRVCHSVRATEINALKSFKTVHHLVSTVTGVLKNNMNAIDLLKATFPPGSITGAPKIRAMEIISELEQQTRGPYCGSLGYICFSGDMDMSVIIRTYFIKQNTLFFSAGGAIVLDSDPEDEYQESLTKAEALIKAIQP